MRKFINFMRAVPFQPVENGKGKCKEIWNCSNRKFSIKIWYDFYGRHRQVIRDCKLQKRGWAGMMRKCFQTWAPWACLSTTHSTHGPLVKCLKVGTVIVCHELSSPFQEPKLSSPSEHTLLFHFPISLSGENNRPLYCMSKFNFLNFYFSAI